MGVDNLKKGLKKYIKIVKKSYWYNPTSYNTNNNIIQISHKLWKSKHSQQKWNRRWFNKHLWGEPYHIEFNTRVKFFRVNYNLIHWD